MGAFMEKSHKEDIWLVIVALAASAAALVMMKGGMGWFFRWLP
jgi:ATP-dependent protease ClpP protease subunit